MIKLSDGRFAHGEIYDPVKGHYFEGPLIELGGKTDENGIVCTLNKGGWGRWRYCKYCYRTVAPYNLREESEMFGIDELCICSNCGAGIDMRELVVRELD